VPAEPGYDDQFNVRNTFFAYFFSLQALFILYFDFFAFFL